MVTILIKCRRDSDFPFAEAQLLRKQEEKTHQGAWFQVRSHARKPEFSLRSVVWVAETKARQMSVLLPLILLCFLTSCGWSWEMPASSHRNWNKERTSLKTDLQDCKLSNPLLRKASRLIPLPKKLFIFNTCSTDFSLKSTSVDGWGPLPHWAAWSQGCGKCILASYGCCNKWTQT